MSKLIQRHLIAGLVGGLLIYLFWLSRPEWVAEMRFWRAVGDASLIFLYATLVIGPLSRFVPRVGKFLIYRREMGIWFGIFAIAHTVLILNGWMRWEFLRFMGYELVPQAGRMIRLESGFGMANILGFIAVVLALPLMATSADWAVRYLGGSAWKFLHYSAHIIFYLVVLHTAYFLYIHYTASFHREPPPDTNWFQLPFLAMTLIIFGLQVGAFIKTVRQQRIQAERRSTNGKAQTRKRRGSRRQLSSETAD